MGRPRPHRVRLPASRSERRPRPAERFFGNRVVAAADAAFDIDRWHDLAIPGQHIAAGRPVTLGFDGARRRDSTALVATDIESGHQVVVAAWDRPTSLHEDDQWEIPDREVDEAVASAFDVWDVWRLYADPPYWESAVDRWTGRFANKKGDPRVVAWWTNRRRPMAFALRAYRNAMTDGSVTHDGDPLLAQHIGNADESARPACSTMRATRQAHRQGPARLAGQDRPAMAACLSWKRGDAIAAGVLDTREATAPTQTA